MHQQMERLLMETLLDQLINTLPKPAPGEAVQHVQRCIQASCIELWMMLLAEMLLKKDFEVDGHYAIICSVVPLLPSLSLLVL